jgi:hypothetical protein
LSHFFQYFISIIRIFKYDTALFERHELPEKGPPDGRKYNVFARDANFSQVGRGLEKNFKKKYALNCVLSSIISD